VGAAEPIIVVQPVQRPPGSAYARGIRVAVVPARSFPVSVIDPQAKYSARLGSVLAIMDAQVRGAEEALFGIVKHGAVLTPPCAQGLLAGITRDVLQEVVRRLRIPLQELPLTRHDLYNATEAFLSSTIKEVLPVAWIDGRRVGTGRPGPVTRRIGRAFGTLVRRELQLQ
jgi:branched-chain amino acid aminotransferase